MVGHYEQRTLTLTELADLSGLSLSTLRRRVKDGSIPVIQPGGAGKKLLFVPAVLNSLSAARGAEDRSDADTAPRRVTPAGHSIIAGSADGTLPSNAPCCSDASKRAHSGPIPYWMCSRYFNHQNIHDSKQRCQEHERTN